MKSADVGKYGEEERAMDSTLWQCMPWNARECPLEHPWQPVLISFRKALQK